MRDELPAPDPPGDDLLYQAMLYASGELDAGEAAAFEQRLGEDQAARDALCQAVGLNQSLAGEAPVGPDPTYRSGVRHRLRQRRRQRAGLRQTPTAIFSHPAFWSILGAAIAILLMMLVSHYLALTDVQPGNPRITPSARETPKVETSLAEPVTAPMADAWADLSNNDRLVRAQREVDRRKARAGHRRLTEVEPIGPENGKN